MTKENFFMENSIKRIGYLPRKRVLEIIDKISKTESISRSKVVGILVEEALGARGIDNFGFGNKNHITNNNLKNFSNSAKNKPKINLAEDEFVDDTGYTFSSNNNLERDISSSDIELANKINLLKKSGLI
tara:strand:+ start:309 stop:698 length:390 start_codon:yes stop_codon:yes gene_type:complete